MPTASGQGPGSSQPVPSQPVPPQSAPSTSHGSSKHTTVASPSSSPAQDNAEITSFAAVAHCASRSDTAGTVTLTWTSGGGATKAYLLESPTATTGGDGATSSGGVGPLPANGSTKLPFACGEDYDFFTLYVHAATTKSGETLLVPNNT